MSAANLSINELNDRRKKAIKQGHYCEIVAGFTCPETRVGVVIGKSRYSSKPELTAYFFRPAQMNRSFANESFQGSGHDFMSALTRAKEKIAFEKAEKKAPHNFEVGDIIASVWGVTSKDVNFYRVLDASKPRSVKLVELGSRFHDGDWCAGSKVPTEQILGEPFTQDTYVKNGESFLKSNSITYARKWKGNPVSVHCD